MDVTLSTSIHLWFPLRFRQIVLQWSQNLVKSNTCDFLASRTQIYNRDVHVFKWIKRRWGLQQGMEGEPRKLFYFHFWAPYPSDWSILSVYDPFDLLYERLAFLTPLKPFQPLAVLLMLVSPTIWRSMYERSIFFPRSRFILRGTHDGRPWSRKQTLIFLSAWIHCW